MNFRVATWNVLYRDREERFDSLIAQLRAVEADVILLQESAPAHAYAVAEALGMHAECNAGAYIDAEAANIPAVLTHLPGTAIPFAIGDANDRLRIAGTVLDVNGRSVRLVSTHLQHTHHAGRMGVDNDYRQASYGGLEISDIADDSIRTSVAKRLEQLAEFQSFRGQITDTDVEIVGGDFNCVPDGIEYHSMIGYGFRDSWRAGPRLGHGATILERNPLIGDGRGVYSALAATTLPGYTGDLDYTLDFQFHAGEVTVGRAWTIGEPQAGTALWPSDHLGIVVDYNL